jgi:hypothetical protein
VGIKKNRRAYSIEKTQFNLPNWQTPPVGRRESAVDWSQQRRREAGKVGAATVPVIDPPADTEKAKTAPVIRTYAFPGPNMTPAETWTSGHRTPYGLAFAQHPPDEPAKRSGDPVTQTPLNSTKLVQLSGSYDSA